MGFIKAFTGAMGATFADQWKDFYVPETGVPATAAIYKAVPQGQNAGIGENTKGSTNIISNGSKIIVPEGTALITVQDGAITGFISEPGGYIFNSADPNSQSIFAGDGLLSATIGQSWERFKFGGIPATQQLAFYVNTKEIAGNKYGTQEPIYWQDSYLDMQAGGMVRGTYSVKIVDPLLFVKEFASEYLRADSQIFDFDDLDNPKVDQLFNEFRMCLEQAVSILSMGAKENNINTMQYIQQNQVKVATTIGEEIEKTHQWSTKRGVSVVAATMTVAYDEHTSQMLKEIMEDDQEIRKAKRMGEAFSGNMQGMMAAASAQAMQNAASNEGGAMMGFMGMNMAGQAGANMMNAVNMTQPQQPVQQQMPQQPIETPQMASQQVPAQPATAPAEDPYAKLAQMKKLLDDGVITQADFDAAKAKLLGL